MDLIPNAQSLYKRANPESRAAFERGRQVMPGVAKGAYYFKPFPLTMARGDGCELVDIDGHSYVDFTSHHTAQVLGHGHPDILAAVRKQMDTGIAIGAPTGLETALAEEICGRVDSVDQIRFCNSGTEASLHAVRLARAFTGKPKIAKFEGGYHGSHDGVEISVSAVPDRSGPSEAPLPVPTAAGMAPHATDDVLILPYNDETAVESLISRHHDDLAAVLLDPKCGLLHQRPAFIQAVREITNRYGLLLIFDEIVGFRSHAGGMQAVYGITPDLTLFGKIIGGGFPIGAFGGRREIMALLDPTENGILFQSGTFSGHPVAMAAGFATLNRLTPTEIDRINGLTNHLHHGLIEVFSRRTIPAQVVSAGSVFSIYFLEQEPWTARDILSHDTTMEHAFFLALINQGYFLGAGTRMCCLSTSMDAHHVSGLIDACDRILA